MDAELLAALAQAGGSALVGAVATDAWQSARSGFAQLLGRGDAGRRALVEARLDTTAAEVEKATDTAREQVRAAQTAAWQTRLADLLDEHPELATGLQNLNEEVFAGLPVERQTRVQAVSTGRIDQTGGGVAVSGVFIGDVRAGR